MLSLIDMLKENILSLIFVALLLFLVILPLLATQLLIPLAIICSLLPSCKHVVVPTIFP